ncbi:hypothetical protein C8E03_10458 [Lachnotalea glycerini]|uniref:Uncharacterized protein n=1 Tax=Lachnotalea glycerini TaxID=1763509 RepID=A0A255I1U5_9FIRM|nr:hypothetical protein [Lachnotalea glycerini]PXV91051.1 hypothetical protein C8E03_10458 [Lachnotalea glycerini]RDY30074.1 hypothetical protein CG710_016675 [Lachnotalea glycerini]
MKLSKIELFVYACVAFIAFTVSDRLNYNALSWQSFLIIVIPLLITDTLFLVKKRIDEEHRNK